jgi:hypothetical protein
MSEEKTSSSQRSEDTRQERTSESLEKRQKDYSAITNQNGPWPEPPPPRKSDK